MTDLDDRVRTLLETRARDVAVNPEMPRTVAGRSKRRRALVGAGAGLGVLAASVLGAAAFREAAFKQETGSTPTLTVEPAPVAPATFVGFREGEIVLVDVASGEPIRVLVDRATLGAGQVGGTVDLEMSPDGSTLYFVALAKPERIMSVPIAGGEPVFVAEGRKPTVRADGRYLAYVTCGGELGTCGEGVSILDLASGTERHWSVGVSDSWAGSLAWLPDPNLAFSMFAAGDSNPTMHVLSIDDDDLELRELAEIGPDRTGEGWTVVQEHVPTSGVVVRQYCCSSYATDEVEESSVISVSARGDVLATLLPRADWIDIELDASGNHFLLLEMGGGVYRIDEPGAEPEPIADAEGFEDIDW